MDIQTVIQAIQNHDLKTIHTAFEMGFTDANNTEDSLLHLAVRENNIPVVKYLLENNMNPDPRNVMGETPLHLAALIHAPSVGDLLCEAGADVNAVDNKENTPLHNAFLSDHPSNEMVKVLLKFGANPSIQNNEKCTPVHYAAIANHSKVLESMLYMSEDAFTQALRTKNIEHQTPLDMAQALGRTNAVSTIEKFISHHLEEFPWAKGRIEPQIW